MAGRDLIRELRRRHVFRVAVAYTVVGWALIEVSSTIIPALHLPESLTTAIVVLVLLGFPAAVVLAWAFEVTPEGVRRTEPADSPAARAPEHAQHVGKHLNAIIIGVLALAVAVLLWQRFAPSTAQKGTTAVATSEKPNPATPTVSGTKKVASIAVLPFVNMTSDKEQDYFSDGLSEELLNQLAQVPELRVIARTSSFSFKGQEVDVATIAKALDVANILEGSVRKSGNTLRITAQLIRAADSSHLWSQTYDRKLTDIFKVQDEISSDVVDALKLKLLPGQQPVKLQHTTNTTAYQLYLLGKDIQTRGGDHPRGVRALRQAVALDPGYANAWAELATALTYQADVEDSTAKSDEDIKQGFAAVERAIALAPDLAQGYASRGRLRYNRSWDWQGAQADFARGYTLDPNNVVLLNYYATSLFFISGRREEAIAMSRNATTLDPLSSGAWQTLGVLLHADGQTRAAHDAFQQTMKINPGNSWAHYLLGYDQLKAGKAENALSEFQLALEDSFILVGTAMAEHSLGHARESQQAQDALQAKYAAGYAFQLAGIHAWRGENDQAFEWLERAYQQRDAGMPRLRYDPTLASLRDDPRFTALVTKMDFPE